MIAGCPNCAAKYRIDPAKLRPEGARLRCSRCETVFRVQPDAGEAPAAAATPAPVASPARSAAPAAPAASPRATALAARALSPRTAAPAPPAAGDPEKRVMIAHPEVESGKRVADVLASWGLSPLLVHDGVEAILQIQRTLPRIVVLDAALPKMFGFQICEIMKRNEQLRAIPVVLIGAIHDQGRYRRPPEELYGADAYLERQQLPDALAELFARFGVPTSGAASAPSPASASAPSAPARAAAPAPARPARPAPPAPARAASPPAALAPAPARAPSPPAALAPARAASPPAALAPAPAPASARAAAPAPPTAPAANPEIEKAQRLARIIVSDVILYNPEKFEAAVRAGNVVDALSAELQEGYSLFASRVDARVFDPREFLQRELVRVARSRGMK